MDTIGQIADKKCCSGVETPNTGKLGCLSLFGTPTHLIAIRKGEIIPKNTVFDLDFVTQLVQAGVAVPLIGASSFEDLSADDTYSTNSKRGQAD